MDPSHFQNASKIILFFFLIFYSLLQIFANKPGDWGEKSLSEHDSLYFVLTTLSTIGYGDITPQSKRAKNLIMFFQIIILIQLYLFTKL